MTGHGGRRAGAGRRPKALRYAKELAAAERKIVSAAPKIIDALVRAAESGDASAGRYLLDRLWGRVKEQASVLAEDVHEATDDPRVTDRWAAVRRERDVAELMDQTRRSSGTESGELTARILEMANRVALAQSKMNDDEWRAFEAAQSQRLELVERIIDTEPRARWTKALVEAEQRLSSGADGTGRLLHFVAAPLEPTDAIADH